MKETAFNGQRLEEALRIKLMNRTELAKTTGISKQAISQYVNNDSKPSFEKVLTIAEKLNFPIEFFFSQDLIPVSTTNTYFRSQAAARKRDQVAQKIKLEYVSRIYKLLSGYVDFPKPDFFNLNLHNTTDESVTQNEYSFTDIESVAEKLRKKWELGASPIKNMQFLLESHGIIVTGFDDIDNKIDAFSQKVVLKGSECIFIIALSLSKSKCRQLFDLAHELGHIVLHEWDDSFEELNKEDFNRMEAEANFFASAFLLPKDSFSKDVSPYPTNLDYYILLKRKWHVSIQAMIYRARQLGIITQNQLAHMMRNISVRGWRKKEPDDVIGTLQATIFQGAIDALLDAKVLTTEDILNAFNEAGLNYGIKNLESLMCLTPGTLKVEPKVIKFAIKPKNN